ncbi:MULTISPECIES: c-type cytochrome biogenesis protein CcmI [Lentibacter]|jgi:cytochrome c-type biogenesis protein CcmH|uniref:Cytochrome c-type biogenesis protein CcmH n=1 Tax=Lentibacter algarum TaxID=576131 RepID=A0A1H3IAB6_9RHOB|nr:c-type cytochrome biogenesis protein CcmI [Lentibacter algarum]MCO4776320.1 c-type cytochrome biogenesis protein CcmI [Lentibacter algarum]WIF31403.1 cytochrome c-type biogenesis protein CycH [Lentibacter algarum]SDY24676.1 cytochrome c-type biogenesis protein CcmH [Lentibacter algarum]
MLFWIISAALALLIAALFALALLTRRAEAEHPAAYDLRIYRDQLKEVERDLARGVINEADAERIRTEVGRRVLAADAQLAIADVSSQQPRALTIVIAATIALILTGGGVAIYTQLGTPGLGDLPHKARLQASQDLYSSRSSHEAFLARLPVRNAPQQEAGYLELVERLREAVASRPDELQGQQFLAQSEARLGNYAAARAAQSAVIRLKGEAVGASDFVTMAQMYITEADGYVSPEAEAALRRALRADRTDPVARYFLGQMWLQNDRPDRAFGLWSQLLNEGPEEAPWIAPIRQSIDDIAWLAGVEYTQPAPSEMATDMPGPTVQDIENAGEMTPEERQEMVQSMVQRLNDRLATEGGTPEEWARLISAYGSLGDEGRARAIWLEAQQRFADTPDALETVRRGAARAGVDQ